MTRAALLCLVLAACSDETIDTLPKRGDSATDPTVVAVSGDCGGTANQYIDLQVQGSDPEGPTNLMGCMVSIDGRSGSGTFSSGGTTCFPRVDTPCTPNASMTVEVTVTNATGGFTSATVSIVPVP